jgi:hypothetical protein
LQFYHLGDPKFGVKVYKNTIPAESNIPNRLCNLLDNSTHEHFRWHDSLVGEGIVMPEYRDCVDFKMDESFISGTPKEYNDIINVYNTVANAQKTCLREYESNYNIHMKYMEAINFVKYGADQHFSVHTDHGFSYICTVSCVTYLNDDYSGGELYFPYLDIEWRPESGDSIFFPSTFIYAHSSKPVKSGVKFSAVTMFDYNDDAHQYGGVAKASGSSKYQAPASENNVVETKAVLHNKVSNTLSNEESLRKIIREEIQAYAMESWKQWQENGGANQEYSAYVAGVK